MKIATILLILGAVLACLTFASSEEVLGPFARLPGNGKGGVGRVKRTRGGGTINGREKRSIEGSILLGNRMGGVGRFRRAIPVAHGK